MTTTKRTYENLYIIDIDNTAEQMQAITDKYAGVVSGQGGEVIAAGLWDRRKLAFTVKGKNEGCYILMYFTAEPEAVAELDRVMRISEDVLRHLILNVDPQRVDVSIIRSSESEAPAPSVETTEETASAQETAEEADTAKEETMPVEEETAPAAEEPVQATEEEAASE